MRAIFGGSAKMSDVCMNKGEVSQQTESKLLRIARDRLTGGAR